MSDAVARYGDIIFRERPVHDGDVFSRRHPKMERLNRAKLFAPFAALVGFDERVSRKEVPYVPRHELDADEEWALGRKLVELRRLTENGALARENRVRVCVERFVLCDDAENAAYGVKGRYSTVTGTLLNVDTLGQRLTVQSEAGCQVISFSDIYRIREPSGRTLQRY